MFLLHLNPVSLLCEYLPPSALSSLNGKFYSEVTTCFAVGSLTREAEAEAAAASPSCRPSQAAEGDSISAGMQKRLQGLPSAGHQLLFPRETSAHSRGREALRAGLSSAWADSFCWLFLGSFYFGVPLSGWAPAEGVHACVPHRTGGKSAQDPQGASSPSARGRRRIRSGGRARRRRWTTAGWWVEKH